MFIDLTLKGNFLRVGNSLSFKSTAVLYFMEGRKGGYFGGAGETERYTDR